MTDKRGSVENNSSEHSVSGAAAGEKVPRVTVVSDCDIVLHVQSSYNVI